jgi:glucose/arabinose dehydrogenase
VPFKNSKPFGQPIEILKGFVSADGDAFGRPVGIALDKQGAVLVADDVGNIVWRVIPLAKSPLPTQVQTPQH